MARPVYYVGRLGPAPRRRGAWDDPGARAWAVALEALGGLAGYPLPPSALEWLRLARPVVVGLARAGGRGGDPEALGAAAAYYAYTVHAVLAGAAGVPAARAMRVLGVPRSSWYRALRQVFEGMGHHPLLWRPFLEGRLEGRRVPAGARAWCRREVLELVRPGGVVWGRVCPRAARPRPPQVPGGILLAWRVSRVPRGLLEGGEGGGGVVDREDWVAARLLFDPARFARRLAEWFGDGEFTARDVAAKIGATPDSTARLLGRLARAGYLARRKAGSSYRYRVVRA